MELLHLRHATLGIVARELDEVADRVVQRVSMDNSMLWMADYADGIEAHWAESDNDFRRRREEFIERVSVLLGYEIAAI